jgi:hypothetical protein
MSGDVWVFGLNASLAWWLIHRVRVANRAPSGPGPTGSSAWWAAQPPAERYGRSPVSEEDRQDQE